MVAIVKYNAGNIHSVQNALKRLGVESIVTDEAEALQQAAKVIFPGVGAAGSAMQYLKEKGLDAILKNLHQPFLGICLGLQLMCAHSEEDDTDCLGIFPSTVKKFPPKGKVPHMGWNNPTQVESPLFEGVSLEDNFYFVHSYFASLSTATIAQAEYLGEHFSTALHQDNFWAVQFHPEKSSKIGEQLLKNFLAL